MQPAHSRELESSAMSSSSALTWNSDVSPRASAVGLAIAVVAIAAILPGVAGLDVALFELPWVLLPDETPSTPPPCRRAGPASSLPRSARSFLRAHLRSPSRPDHASPGSLTCRTPAATVASAGARRGGIRDAGILFPLVRSASVRDGVSASTGSGARPSVRPVPLRRPSLSRHRRARARRARPCPTPACSIADARSAIGPAAASPRARLRAEFFALAREASRRALGLRPFDVQVVAALALDAGRIVEMQTGEGKTLAAVMPAALNALGGRGVHVLTFNDYLARRDAEWMGPVYRAARALGRRSFSRA